MRRLLFCGVEASASYMKHFLHTGVPLLLPPFTQLEKYICQCQSSSLQAGSFPVLSKCLTKNAILNPSTRKQTASSNNPEVIYGRSLLPASESQVKDDNNSLLPKTGPFKTEVFVQSSSKQKLCLSSNDQSPNKSK